MKEVFRDVENRMKHAVEHFHNELKHLRTGRASLALLDGLTVEYYGTPMPINQLATLSVADATMITAQPFDPNVDSQSTTPRDRSPGRAAWDRKRCPENRARTLDRRAGQ